MTQDGADGLERRAGTKHGRCGGMAKKTRSFGRWILDAGPSQGAVDDIRDRRGRREWAIGRLRSQEQLIFRDHRPPVLDVCQRRVADVLG